MAKVLVAIRLPKRAVDELKALSVAEGRSQADLVLSSLALYQSFSLYKQKLCDKEKAQSYTKDSERTEVNIIENNA